MSDVLSMLKSIGTDFKMIQSNAEKGKYGREVADEAKMYAGKADKLIKALEKMLFGETTNTAGIPNLIVLIEALQSDYMDFVDTAIRFNFFTGKKRKFAKM